LVNANNIFDFDSKEDACTWLKRKTEQEKAVVDGLRVEWTEWHLSGDGVIRRTRCLERCCKDGLA
jgi:hypothetical protein